MCRSCSYPKVTDIFARTCIGTVQTPTRIHRTVEDSILYDAGLILQLVTQVVEVVNYAVCSLLYEARFHTSKPGTRFMGGQPTGL